MDAVVADFECTQVDGALVIAAARAADAAATWEMRARDATTSHDQLRASRVALAWARQQAAVVALLKASKS